ncbi:MAG: HlyD family secretion protein [Candidatus Binatus sp.]|uniref:efflux RND transporter periplasmic adaptor subunit n=1 Tax=Candidatus Binatus sp. TaxID=2811406 RepID=UPI003BAE9E03
MDNNGRHSISGTEIVDGTVEHHDEADLKGPSISEEQKSLHEEVERLRLEVEHLLDQQKALQKTPQSDDLRVDEDVKDHEGDDSSARNPGDRRGVLNRRPVRLMLAVVVASLLCAGGIRFWNYLQSYEWTDDAEIDGHLDPISTRINDTVIRVYVENTYHVKEGQTLVDLDPRDYQVAVENAEANLAQAKQGVKAARQNYELAVANLNAAIATNYKAQLDVKRFGELLEQAVISREVDDEIVMTGRVDAAAVNSDRAEIRATAQMVGQAQAAVQAAQASLDQAKLNLSYTHIVAPATGVVGDKTVQVGQRVQPGEQLLSVVPLNDIWITADFRETQLHKMHRGQPVTVHVDTTGRDYKGYIEGLPGATGELDSLLPPENATGNYVKVVQRLPVRIRLYPGEDRDHRLRPGMSVEPTVWVTGHPRTLW